MSCTAYPELKQKSDAFHQCHCGMMIKNGEKHPEPSDINPDREYAEMLAIRDHGADAIYGAALAISPLVAKLSRGIFPSDCQYSHTFSRVYSVSTEPGALSALVEAASAELTANWKTMAEHNSNDDVDVNAVLLTDATYHELRDKWVDDMNWCPGTQEDARKGLMGTYRDIAVYTDTYKAAHEKVNMDLCIDTSRIHRETTFTVKEHGNAYSLCISFHMGCDSSSIKHGLPENWK